MRGQLDGQNETDEMVKQDGYRTDRASTFVVERVKMFLTSSWSHSEDEAARRALGGD